ncbi:L-type lectin-domain containing receptor kinase IX.1-like [Senna tora]|uniref:non-specific serine/threonine protein kinase n=1 Tax=Senna tora TaxID=362788 RepID=A0A834XD16_9FABA|nr:L-type lectin-domain containing receptor kinase IX.1-like [Senna tora]
MEASHYRRKTLLLLPCLAITKVLLCLIIIPPAASITFDYQKFHNYEKNLKLERDVHPENGVLQLTRYKSDSVGRVTYKEKLQLWDTETRKIADFTTNFSFIINSSDSNHRGDGITFFLAHPDFPFPNPPDGSGIGLMGRTEIFQNPSFIYEHPFVAVEFDTFPNKDLGDPPYDHVGINVNNMWTKYTTQWYTIKDGRHKYDAKIIYNSSSHFLNVIFTGYNKNNVRVLQKYSHEIDLSDVLPSEVQFGISSATGYIFETHTLCSWSFESSSSSKDSTEWKKKLIIGLSIGLGVLICGLFLAWLVMIWKRNKYDLVQSLDSDFESIGPKKFSYEELVKATNNFSEEHKLGQGGFGGVYRGFIRDINTYVAVKKVSEGSKQGVKEYVSEVKTISQLRHKNLVQLIGWCHQKIDLLLVYDFMPNGSLDYHLFRTQNLLTWPTRYAIAQGLASAIVYLHEEWQQCVVHRDIKPSNVMLDSDFNAKLGDFGLARMVEHSKGSTETTVLAGTKGYMAPECPIISKATKESDVYSFGVVALELSCGRKPIVLGASEEQVVMVEWVWELYGLEKLLEAADPRLCGDFKEQELERLMIVGLWCAHPDYVLRPTIRQAINVLSFEASVPSLPPKMPTFTYDTPSPFEIGSSSSSLSPNATSFGITQTKPEHKL